MVIVAGHITVEPEERASYLADCVSVVERARGAAGCLDVAIGPDLIDPSRISILERLDSRAAVEAFRGTGPNDEQTAAIRTASIADYDVGNARPFFETGTHEPAERGPGRD